MEARFLIAAIAPVALMLDDVVDAEGSTDLYGIVGAGVIDKYDFIDQIEGDFVVGGFERFGRIVGGKHYHYFLSVDHGDANVRS